MAEQAQPKKKERLTSARKNGLKSILYGSAVAAGFIIGGPVGYGIIVGATGGSAIQSYKNIKKAISNYKSDKENDGAKADSYLGKGLCYLGRAAGTIALPWLEPVGSISAGIYRILSDKNIKHLDYPETEKYDAEEKKKIEEAAAQKMKEEEGKKDK